jgi:hypothetical protein
MIIQLIFCLELLYRVLNDDYDYTPPTSPPLVDEIQAQHQLPSPARILSAPALQVWAEDDAAPAAALIEVVERLN